METDECRRKTTLHRIGTSRHREVSSKLVYSVRYEKQLRELQENGFYMLADGKKSSDVLVTKKTRKTMKEKSSQTPKFMVEQLVASEFRVNKHGLVTPKSWLKKRAKSTDDIAVVNTTNDES